MARTDLGQRLLAGAAAGLAATVPMTAVMEALRRALPPADQGPLPPRKITERAAARAGVGQEMSEPQRQAATAAAHFGYGAGMGAVYALTAARAPLPAAARGVGFGLAVWAGSYLGLLPALGLHGAGEESPRRNGLMIAAHVVWGLALGTVTRALTEER